MTGVQTCALPNLRGSILRALERYDEAMVSFDRALELEPQSREALNFKGRLLYFQNRNAEAAAIFQKLLAVDPSRPFLRGLVFELKLGAADWRDYDATVADITRRVERGEPVEHPLNFAWYTQSAAAMAACTEIYARRQWPTPKQIGRAHV